MILIVTNHRTNLKLNITNNIKPESLTYD
uniref:Uncharacterized protein n=1 Tax=Arundo donax TaxID=35708 RepID=A0A0A9AS77_ARUDO